MATKRNLVCKEERNFHSFTTVLTLAACEWFLLFLLLIDAVISYALTKFACYCKLQTPCILCSRLDHIFSKEKFDGYHSLLCQNHKIEISSLVSCHIHDKHVDFKEMCEDCLCSFSSKNMSKFTSEVNMLGELKLDFDGNGLPSSSLNRVPGFSGMRSYSCCYKPWRSKKSCHPFTKPNIPLPHLPGRNHRDRLKKLRDKYSCSKSLHDCKNLPDPFADVGYTKLKITSESESEVSFSDDSDDESSMIHKRNELDKDSVVECISQMCNNSQPSLLDSCVPPEFQKYNGEEVVASDKSNTYSLLELDWEKGNHKVNLPALPELILLDDISTLSTTIEKSRLKLPPPQDSDFSELSELIILDDAPPSAGTSPVKSEETGPFDSGSADINRHEDALGFIDTSVEECSEIDRVVCENSTIKAKSYDNHGTIKSCPYDREGEPPSFSVEQSTENNSDMVVADLKTLSSQNSSAEDFSSSSKKSCPGINYYDNELQMVNASSFNELQLEKRLALEECGLESLDESIVSEIEGESIVGRLIRQIECDKKRISALHKELEEERNASEVAVNQAMAMIMRLQEEKAALNLDALQYLRMMEEQAEYDVDALEKANDLLAEKEKEIQDLEAELEMYRLNPLDDKVVECSHKKSEEKFAIGDMIDGIPSKSTDIISSKSIANGISANNNLLLVVESSTLEFEDKKMYIKQCLMRLEKKLNQMSCNGVSFCVSNGVHIAKSVYARKNERESLDFENVDFNEITEHDSLSTKRNRESRNADEDSCASVGDDFIDEEENLKPIGENNSSHQKELDFASLQNELSDLNDRLEALEASSNFLEHSLNILRNDKEGLQFIQEIVYQLKELRELGITLSCQAEP